MKILNKYYKFINNKQNLSYSFRIDPEVENYELRSATIRLSYNKTTTDCFLQKLSNHF